MKCLLTLLLRRMRETIANASQGQVSKVIVAGLSNVYTHYITTYEVRSYYVFPDSFTFKSL